MGPDDAAKRDARLRIAGAAHRPARAPYTTKQGQYLAFIYYYTKIHRRSPSEADMQAYFQAPAVDQMVLSLEKRGLVERTPGQGRSLKLLLPRTQLPDLL